MPLLCPLERVFLFLFPFVGYTKVLHKEKKTDQWKWGLCLFSKRAEIPGTPRELLPVITVFNPTI